MGKDYCTHLDDHLHQILLRDDILADDDLLEDAGKNRLRVHHQVDAVELAEADEVRADENT